MKRLVSMGRGGVGKTSFVALMTKYFLEIRETPILLIDADPDQSLNEMVGIDLVKEGKKTISDILFDVMGNKDIDSLSEVSVSKQERIKKKFYGEAWYEGEDFDSITLGVKWAEGCYCFPNDVLHRLFDEFSKNYEYALIDCPAGLEYLNRRVTSEVHDVFDILDPSRKSFDHVKRVKKIIEDVKIQYQNMYVVGGFRFPRDLEREVEKQTGLKYLGAIVYDEQMAHSILTGLSLLDLPSNSPAYVSVKEIMKKAGY